MAEARDGSIIDQVSDLIGQKHLNVGASIETGGRIIGGNMRVDAPAFHAIYVDDFGRIWKETGGANSAVTLIFDRNQGWL